MEYPPDGTGERGCLGRGQSPCYRRHAERKNGIEKRTRRACTESMPLVAHGEGTGMFDVYSGENGEHYVVDLAGEHDRCTCPDVQHNLEAGERCKHARRVRLEFGLAPFENVPQVRDEHAAPMDVRNGRTRADFEHRIGGSM
jgi:hypothetical protein